LCFALSGVDGRIFSVGSFFKLTLLCEFAFILFCGEPRCKYS
jgi:hypothetical protein